MSNLLKVMQLTNGKSEVTQPISLRAMWTPGPPSEEGGWQCATLSTGSKYRLSGRIPGQ